MSYTTTGGIAGTVALVSSTFRGLPAVAAICSPASPDTRTILGDGGLEGGQFQGHDGAHRALAPPLFVISANQADETMPGLGSWREEGAVAIDCYLPPYSGDTPSEAYLRALDRCESIIAGFRAATATGHPLIIGARLTHFPVLASASCPPAFRNAWYARILLTFKRGIP